MSKVYGVKSTSKYKNVYKIHLMDEAFLNNNFSNIFGTGFCFTSAITNKMSFQNYKSIYILIFLKQELKCN